MGKHRERLDKSVKKFLKEFKQFALRGNVMDMAVGIIIGGAFTGIVTSLTENFINPILNLLTGQAVYTGRDIIGFLCAFLTAVLNFIIMAFILFCLIKGINKMAGIGRKKEEPAPVTTKICPYCKSEIPLEATRCAHCTSELQ